ncbi:hypothetical protein ACRARG_14995 [Pseudooceanicola sp. C21-150M6]|uniref:hypothetical protein n=1 Tax=Pseudooceanicola sp. C21-150M6 TaxID=3434355 RepID=UPI003D7F446C
MTRPRLIPALSAVLSLALLPVAAPAQEVETPEAETEEAPSLMERGAKLFFRGLTEEMAPAIRDMQRLAEEHGPALMSFIEEMGPALSELFQDIKDFSAYEAPEILPNGDIIIRKKLPEPPHVEEAKPDENGQIDL